MHKYEGTAILYPCTDEHVKHKRKTATMCSIHRFIVFDPLVLSTRLTYGRNSDFVFIVAALILIKSGALFVRLPPIFCFQKRCYL